MLSWPHVIDMAVCVPSLSIQSLYTFRLAFVSSPLSRSSPPRFPPPPLSPPFAYLVRLRHPNSPSPVAFALLAA